MGDSAYPISTESTDVRPLADLGPLLSGLSFSTVTAAGILDPFSLTRHLILQMQTLNRKGREPCTL